MTEKETAQILGILGIAYQNFNVDRPKIQVWHSMLGDLDFKLAEAAIKKLISESPYPPTIHDVRERALEIITPDVLTPAEAWGVVLKNISKYGSYRVKEGLEALPPLIKKTVDCMGYVTICRSEDGDGVTRAQFMRMYEQIMNRRKNEQLLPAPLKEQIKAIANNMAMLSEGKI